MKHMKIVDWIYACSKKVDYDNMSYTEKREYLLSCVKRGCLRIPDGITEVPERMFDGFTCREKKEEFAKIVSIHIPGSVKHIGERAFAECENIENVVLEEGVERIDSNVFYGCNKLTDIRIPGSVKEMQGMAFYGSGINKPVLSEDGKTFFYYPKAWESEEYAIPEGVEVIAGRAFMDRTMLKKLILPKSLKRISTMAFIRCGFEEIEIPAGTVIEKEAFSYFRRLPEIRWQEKMDAFSERRGYLNCFGIPFLARNRMKLPENTYWKEETFVKLARDCSVGDVLAMKKMTDFFESLYRKTGETFYVCAAHFWRMREYLYGSKEAEAFYIKWCEEHPNAQPNAPFLSEDLCGRADGVQLNALGFMFFDEDREEYSLSGVDKEGVVEVSAWESDEGPDSDGFGREEYYDWWYLNEFLIKPEGVGWVHSSSHNDKRNSEKEFKEIHDQVAKLGK